MVRRLLALSLVAVAAAACSKAAAAPAERTVRIRIHYSAYSLGNLDVSPGETVRFVVTNTDPIDHEFIVGDESVSRRPVPCFVPRILGTQPELR